MMSSNQFLIASLFAGNGALAYDNVVGEFRIQNKLVRLDCRSRSEAYLEEFYACSLW